MTNSNAQPECNPTVEDVAAAILELRQSPGYERQQSVFCTEEPGICRTCKKRLPQTHSDVGFELDGVTVRFPIFWCPKSEAIFDEAHKLVDLRERENQFNKACPALYRNISSAPEHRPNYQRIDWRAYDAVQGWQHDAGKGIFLRGDSGAGKSTAMWHKLRALDKAFVRWEVYSGQALSKAYFNTIDQGRGARDQLFKRMTTVDVLALDDFGKDLMTDGPSGFLFDVMNARFEHCLPILATTRFDSQTLPTRFEHDRTKGDDLVRRIQDYCRVIAFHDQTKEAPLPI